MGFPRNLTDRSRADSNQDFIRLIKKFTDLCMSSFPNQATPCYWDGLRVTLIRCLEGPPIGRHGLFHGVVFTVFHLLEGSVKMKKDGKSAEARKGQWIACQPGERFQDFSDSARILSVHLLIESPANATAWTGAPLVTLEADASLERRARRLRDTAILRRVRASGALTPQSEPATFPEMMALQEATAAFFVRLLELLEMAGMRYDAPLIRDIRVSETRQRLASASLRTSFSRESLASGCNLSAAQLDRLWRQELDMTPAQFWNQRRVQTACALLQGDGHTIKEVAYETGFGHLSQFSFWFTKNLKESPRKFRARHERD
jgi:AraC-like DNA-binding protein